MDPERHGVVGTGVAGGWLAAAALAALLVAATQRALRHPRRHPPPDADALFPAYLLFVGIFALGAYVCVPALTRDVMLVRYTLLFLLSLVGLLAWFFRAETSRGWQAVGAAAVILWAGANFADHARLAREYVSHPPPGKHRTLARYLEARGIRYGIAPYWTAYHVSFLTAERVRLTPDVTMRIPEYDREYHRHQAEAVRITTKPFPGATHVCEWCVAPARGEPSLIRHQVFLQRPETVAARGRKAPECRTDTHLEGE
ncbi:MAG: hypothetical protein HY321_11120 [Armatimonadetes bacterium]|nr:hypothetical protein [Armatimonadota bacterium]